MDSELDLQTCPLCGRQPKKTNYLDLIKKSVCKKYKITKADIESPLRKAHIVKARNEAMILCRQQTDATLEEIGKCFNRHYSTVLYALHAGWKDEKYEH